MKKPRRSLAVARHALATNLRTGLTWGGVGLLLGVSLLGPLGALTQGDGWEVDGDLVLAGFAAAAVLSLRSGLVEHRLSGLDVFLRRNLVTPVQHMLGAMLSLLASWALLCVVTLALLLVLSGDLGRALWVGWILALRSALLLPWVLVVESVSDLRVPFFVPAFVYSIVLIMLAVVLGEERAVELTGAAIDPSDPATSLPLAVRAVVGLAGGLLLVLAGTAIRARRRRRASPVPLAP